MPSISEKLADMPDWRTMPILLSQMYCLCEDRLLLLKRNTEPNLGLWVAPGGKIEKNESAHDCAVRELAEETGLHAHSVRFRGMISLIMPQVDYVCMQFLYLTTDLSGQLVANEREGALSWWPTGRLPFPEMPDGSSTFIPHVLDIHRPLYQAKYVYDHRFNVVEMTHYSTG
jgi:8-oxo-dGTP diphosphatase